MKIAYFLLVHKNAHQTQRLISRLNNINSSFYVHVDKKVKNIKSFMTNIENLPNVWFIKKRVDVNWGGYSLVQATLNGLTQIVESNEKYDYIILLSGQDYPIKSNQYIYEFFTINNGKEFLHNYPFPTFELPNGGVDRIEYYYDYDNKSNELNAYEIIMKKKGIKRNFLKDLTPYHGSQWWCLTWECIKYVINYLKENKEIINFYRYSKFSDEQFFQTIIMNSPFAENVVCENLRYIDWSTIDWSTMDWITNPPHPKILTIKDYKSIKRTNKLFARKFDEKADERIMDLIDKSLLFIK